MKYLDLFDKYRKEEMSKSEALEFEKQIANDKEVREEYETYATMAEGIRQYERAKLKAFLETPSVVHQKPAKVVKLQNRQWRVWATAAAMVLLLAFPVYQLYFANTNSIDAYEIPQYAINEMSGNTENFTIDKENYNEGLKWYEAKDYEKALVYFEKVTSSTVNAYFLSQYNMAMIYWKDGKEEKAKIILEKLVRSEENHFVKDKAVKLIRSLKKNEK